MSKRLYISMYHYVRDLKNSRYPAIKGLDYSLFKEQIAYFAAHFRVVTMEEVIASYEENYELPDNALLLTFDDGYIDHFTNVLPILNEYHMQGSFFIPGKTFAENKLLDVNKIHFILASAPIQLLVEDLNRKLNHYRGQEYDYDSNEALFQQYAIANRFDCRETIFFKRLLQTVLPEKLRSQIATEIFQERVGISEDMFARELYMNLDQIKYMRRNGMFIGLHGYDHYWLNKLDETQMKQDTDRALVCMDEVIDRERWVMNYPYGSYADQVIDYAKGRGCALGLSTDVGIATEDSPRYALPRFDTNDFPPKSEEYLRF